MKHISCIVPVYQAEKYLRQCVDSLLAQTIKIDEIILIDDCSTDKGGGICDEYCAAYENIKVVHNTENMGLSYARNRGLQLAGGDYITFVDSDDYVENTFIERFIKAFERFEVDFVQCGYQAFSDEEESCKSRELSTDKDSMLKLEHSMIVDSLYGKGDSKLLNFMVWNKMFKKEVIGDRLFSVGKECEDAIFVSSIALGKVSCAVFEDKTYHYRQRPDSIMGRMYSDTAKMIEKHIFAYSIVLREYEGSEPYVKKCLETRLAVWYLSALKRGMLKRTNAEVYKRFREDRERCSGFARVELSWLKRLLLKVV